jgi:hypothetical protein
MIAMKSIIFFLYDFELQNLQKNGRGQIRRVCKVQPPNDNYKLGREISGKYDGKLFWYNPDGFFAEAQHFTCPFGAVGEEIWVKETWGIDDCSTIFPEYIYKADNGFYPEGGWKSPVTMPREASRLTIISEQIQTERLQDITEKSARNIGLKDPYEYQNPIYYDAKDFDGIEIDKCAFAGWWDSRAKPGYKWANNPLVFVAEVKIK